MVIAGLILTVVNLLCLMHNVKERKVMWSWLSGAATVICVISTCIFLGLGW